MWCVVLQEKQILLEDLTEQLNLVKNTAAYSKLPAVGASKIPVSQSQPQTRQTGVPCRFEH